jgi:ABC-type lipoprotein release transport system permease subunit
MIPKNNGTQKHLNFLQYALRSLMVYRARTITVVFSLTVAIFVLGSIVFISDGLSRDALVAANAAPDITVQGMIAGRLTPIALKIGSDIEKFPGVERVIPRMWGYVLYNTKIFTVMGLDSISSPSGIPGLVLEGGRFPNEGEVGEAVIGSYLAASENLKLNSTLPLKAMSGGISGGAGDGMGGGESFNSNFTVIGIFTSDVSLYTSDVILMNYLDAQSLLLQFRIYSATDLCVYLTNSSSTNVVATSIAQSYPELRLLTRDSIVDATSTTYGLRGGFATIMWLMPLATVVLVAWNQASTVGQDSRREVGILKTLGFSTSDIMEIRLIEAVALGFISASIGVFIAIVYDAYLGAPFLREFMLGWSATLPVFKLPLEISFGRMLTLYAIAVFPLLLGSLVPAWLSAITEPDSVLRGS